MRPETPEGWYANQNTSLEVQSTYQMWEPCLQLDGFWIGGGVWFTTERECIDFILDRVLDQRLLGSQ